LARHPRRDHQRAMLVGLDCQTHTAFIVLPGGPPWIG
jgi:hypothetical protein